MTNTIAISAAIANRSLTKSAQILLGICSGITADGQLNDEEIRFLQTWLSENSEVTLTWPGSAISKRIDEILRDNIITNAERQSLLSALQQLSGNQFHDTGSATPAATTLPLDDDPSIFFRNMTYCFTGNFYFGTRAKCERAVLSLEAMAVDRVTSKLDYLVIGSVAEESWANGTYGRKIETAIERRSKHGQPCIISEDAWIKAMDESCR